MRQFLLSLFFVLLLCGTASAQTFSIPPSPGAVLVGTFPIGVERGTDGKLALKAVIGSVGGTETIIGAFRSQAGRTEYMIATDSIRVGGTDAEIDQISTSQIYDALSFAAVQRGIELGYTTPAMPAPYSVKVYAESCVTRTGYGTATRFTPCDRTMFTAREFSIAFPTIAGAPALVGEILGIGTYCTLGYPCEPTNPPTDGDASSSSGIVIR